MGEVHVRMRDGGRREVMMGADDGRERLLVQTEWLTAHLGDPDVRVVDMRGYVRSVEVGPGHQEATYVGAAEEYAQGHIPNAIYLDWTRDIVDPDDPVPVQVASPDRFAAELGRRGIGDNSLVVAYDDHPTAQFATRLWWALRYYGHERAVVLDGGLPKWLREGRPLAREAPSYPQATFTPRMQPEWRVTGDEVLAGLGDAHIRLVDVREKAQYSGALRRGEGQAGHIPGAVNLPRELLVDPATGTFRPVDELRHIFNAAGIKNDERVVAYCNGGVAATTLLFGLALCGYPRLSNYDGSWNEWGERRDWPVETAAAHA